MIRLHLLVEKTEVPGENYQPAASHGQTLSHNVSLSRIRTHHINISGVKHHYPNPKYL
jgi:hypothetical protein